MTDLRRGLAWATLVIFGLCTTPFVLVAWTGMVFAHPFTKPPYMEVAAFLLGAIGGYAACIAIDYLTSKDQHLWALQNP